MPESAPYQGPCIGVATLVWNQGRLLLGERIHPGAANCWQFPGGQLEYAEEVLACAQREVREETGMEIHQLTLAGYSNAVFINNGRHFVTLFVSAQWLRGEPVALEPEKCLGWQWFSPQQLPQPLFTPISNLLQVYPDLNALL